MLPRAPEEVSNAAEIRGGDFAYFGISDNLADALSGLRDTHHIDVAAMLGMYRRYMEKEIVPPPGSEMAFWEYRTLIDNIRTVIAHRLEDIPSLVSDCRGNSDQDMRWILNQKLKQSCQDIQDALFPSAKFALFISVPQNRRRLEDTDRYQNDPLFRGHVESREKTIRTQLLGSRLSSGALPTGIIWNGSFFEWAFDATREREGFDASLRSKDDGAKYFNDASFLDEADRAVERRALCGMCAVMAFQMAPYAWAVLSVPMDVADVFSSADATTVFLRKTGIIDSRYHVEKGYLDHFLSAFSLVWSIAGMQGAAKLPKMARMLEKIWGLVRHADEFAGIAQRVAVALWWRPDDGARIMKTLDEIGGVKRPVKDAPGPYGHARRLEWFSRMRQSEHTKDFARVYGPPRHEVNAGGNVFLCTDSFRVAYSGADYRQVVAYVEVDGVMQTRLFYKSQSGGVWKSCPGARYDDDYSKGESIPGYSYEKTTSVSRELNDFFESLPISAPPTSAPDPILYSGKYNPNELSYGFNSWGIRRETQVDDSFLKQNAVAMREGEPTKIIDSVASIDQEFRWLGAHDFRWFFRDTVMDGFETGFRRVEGSYFGNHAILGRYDVDVCLGTFNGRPVEFHFASTPSEPGLVWIHNIRYRDGRVNSFGIDAQQINVWLLGAKPIEYTDQLPLSVRRDMPGTGTGAKHSGYTDIRQYTSELPPVRDYIRMRAARR